MQALKRWAALSLVAASVSISCNMAHFQTADNAAPLSGAGSAVEDREAATANQQVESGKARIDGQVISPDIDVAGVIVFLNCQDPRQSLEQEADKEGRFSFTEISGNCTLHAAKGAVRFARAFRVEPGGRYFVEAIMTETTVSPQFGTHGERN